MNYYHTLSATQLAEKRTQLEEAYRAQCQAGLALDMSRGKPSPAQIDLSRGLLDALNSHSNLCVDGESAANYGAPQGLARCRELFGDVLGVDPASILVSGSSSLNLMFDVVSHGYIKGMLGEAPWRTLAEQPRWLCPVPGYDRHFAITEYFGFENVSVPMDDNGPNMVAVEELVQDERVKGIWCVPRFSNPSGCVYSDTVVKRFAALQPAAKDFRIMWDNAYCVHAFTQDAPEVANIFDYVDANKNLVYEFASTSKITFAGAGIACVAASKADLADLMTSTQIERVCSDKVSQLAHATFLPSREAVLAHMAQIAELMEPKFALVDKVLSKELGELHVATWTKPEGGYFVSFDGEQGSATEIVELCQQAGLILTPAGATWPGGRDPQDANIRIAPSYPSLEELEQALYVFCLCVKLQAVRAAQRELR